MAKILNLKLVILLEYQNIEKNCERLFPNWSEEEFVIKKVKNTLLLTYVISDCNREKNVRKFYIKELQKTNEKGLK